MPAKLLIVLLTFSTVVDAQSGTSAKASVMIVSPASVAGTYYTAALERDNSNDVVATIFSRPSSKSAKRSSFRLPILKQQISFATLRLNNFYTEVDISLPQTVLLKSRNGSEAIVAYRFEHCLNLVAGIKKIQVIQLSAFVASATDQETGVYASEPIEVIVNYN